MRQPASKRHSSSPKRARKAKPQPIRWPKPAKRRILPSWVPVLTALGLCTMLVLTINFRAFSELNQETSEFDTLNGKIQQATSENLSLQEEIYYLKNDPNAIEREAKKFGLAIPKQEAKEQTPEEHDVKKPDAMQTKKEKVSRAGEPDKAEQSANRQLPTRK